MRHSYELLCSDVRILEKLDREESRLIELSDTQKHIYIYYPKQMLGEQFALYFIPKILERFEVRAYSSPLVSEFQTCEEGPYNRPLQ